MRAISLTALNQYRTGAKQLADLDYEVLKIRINCLIDSVDQVNISYHSGGKYYRFGNCVISVNHMDQIIGIRWSQRKQSPLYIELFKMEINYIKNGLNKKGNKFSNQKEITA